MSTNRRDFIEKIGASAMLGALPLSALSPMLSAASEPIASGSAEDWDFSWTAKLAGKKHKALFDCTEVESGYGVWRASVWAAQYAGVLGAKPAEMQTVLILRHNALVMAFQQSLWDAASIGEHEKVTHPITMQSTTKNPALLRSADKEVPEMIDAFALPNFISRGGIVLCCNLALDFFAAGMARRLNITPAEARTRAIAAMLPGTILMPSGVMAAVRAQQEGCLYVKGS